MTLSMKNSTIMLIVIMLRVAFYFCNAECRYAEWRYAECWYAECRYAECRYAECRYAECRYAEWRGVKAMVVQTCLRTLD